MQLILLTYNVGDLVGKWFYTWKQVPDNLFPHILGLSRIFYPLFICIIFGSMQLTSLKDKPWITLLYTSTMAISNGYMTSALFALSASRCSAKHKDNAGFLMTLAMNLGLMYGALCVAAGSSLD